MKYSYKTNNICPKEIKFEIEGDVITNVEFIGAGCPGNLQSLSKLVDGMTVDEINKKIGGIKCGNRNTSCPDQLARAVKEANEKMKQTI